jgi:hypothetical protein
VRGNVYTLPIVTVYRLDEVKISGLVFRKTEQAPRSELMLLRDGERLFNAVVVC